MKKETTNKVVIDRIEDDLAVIVLYTDDAVKFNLPVACLPEGVKEGDHLQMSFAVDEESRLSQKSRISDLLAELTGKKEGE